MPTATLCHWAEGTIFLEECEAQAEVLRRTEFRVKNYACLALGAVLLACLAVAVWAHVAAYAWRHHRVGRGETRTRKRRTLAGQARLEGLHAGSAIPSDAGQWAATASRGPVQAAASCRSTQTDLSIEPDQLIKWLSPDSSPASTFSHHSSRRARPNSDPPYNTPIAHAKAPPDRAACTRQVQVPSVTPRSHTTRRSQRPAAERSSETPDDQSLLTECAASRHASSCNSSFVDKESLKAMTPVARRFPKSNSASHSAPKVKLSSGAKFLAEMVRRHRSAWSAERLAEACESLCDPVTSPSAATTGVVMTTNERDPISIFERHTTTPPLTLLRLTGGLRLRRCLTAQTKSAPLLQPAPPAAAGPMPRTGTV